MGIMTTHNGFIDVNVENNEKAYLVINTTDYNVYSGRTNEAHAVAVSESELESYGWYDAPNLEVGECYESDDFEGAYLMRIA